MGDLALRECGRWLSGGTPDTQNPAYWGGDIPWITSSSLRGRYLDRSVRQLTEEGVAAGSRLVEPGTLIFVVRGMSLKNEFRVGIATRQLAFGQDCKALVPTEGIDPKYLLCALEAAEDRVLRMVDEASHGTGRLQTSLLGSLEVRVPPLEEQRRIAEILDTIDETIQATDRIIAKRRLLRMALIRDQVLPKCGAEVGTTLPAGWVDVRIGDALQQHVEPVRIDDRQTYDLVSIRRRHGGMFHRESLPGSKILGKNMQRVVPGTFVIARRQIVHGACALATPEFAESVMSMSYSAFVGTPICDVRYFFALAQTPRLVRRFWDASHGVVIEKLNFQQEEWLDYRVQLPPIGVQREVIAAVNASEAEIAALEQELEALRGTRIGLASDLLSGRVRTVAA